MLTLGRWITVVRESFLRTVIPLSRHSHFERSYNMQSFAIHIREVTTTGNDIRKEEGVSSIESIGEVTGKWCQVGPREISGDAHSFKKIQVRCKIVSSLSKKGKTKMTRPRHVNWCHCGGPSLYDAEVWMKVHADFPATSVDEDVQNLSPQKPRPKSRWKRAKLHAILSGVQWIEKVKIKWVRWQMGCDGI